MAETAVQRANRIKEEYGLDHVEFKDSFSCEAKIESSDSTDHTVIKYVTKPTVDRSNDIVISQGIDLKDFVKSPQILFGHNYGNDGGVPTLPVGMDKWIKYDGNGLLAKQQYNMVTQLSKELFELHNTGFPLASSIGFIPTKTIWRMDYEEKEWKKEAVRLSEAYGIDKKAALSARRIYETSILLEHSDVNVPANADALALSIKSGEISIKSPELQQIFEGAILRKEVEEMRDNIKVLTAMISEMAIKPQAQQKGITKEYIAKQIAKEFKIATDKLTGRM